MKLLLLHGYTQNGPLFRAKTKGLEKHILKAFPGTVLSYPTAPMRLKPTDIPGFKVSEAAGDESEAYGWWRRSNTADPPEYVGLETGLETIANILASEGPFDGVLGFSQGAAAAALVASLLEGPSRREAFKHAQLQSPIAIPYPASFESLQHPPLKFWVPYCGFPAPGERYTAFYNPKIQTPSCHVIGSLDTLVEESRTQGLVDASGGENEPRVVIHPGGHFVPNGKQYLDALVDFIRSVTATEKKEKTADEKVEDMDVPF